MDKQACYLCGNECFVDTCVECDADLQSAYICDDEGKVRWAARRARKCLAGKLEKELEAERARIDTHCKEAARRSMADEFNIHAAAEHALKWAIGRWKTLAAP
jgi:hypothetical protein